MSSNQQQGQPGQFGAQGQYGAVTGGGFGGSLAKDRDGNPLQGNQTPNQHSAYEGYGANDSTASGGYGRNAAGGAFSRANQMGADASAQGGEQDSYNDYESGQTKSGAETPGYRKEGEEPDSNQQFRGQNLAFTKKNDDEPEI